MLREGVYCLCLFFLNGNYDGLGVRRRLRNEAKISFFEGSHSLVFRTTILE